MPARSYQRPRCGVGETQRFFGKFWFCKLCAELVGNGDSDIGNASGMQSQSMVCLGSGKRKRAFSGVRPRERLRIGWIARTRPIVRVPNLIGTGTQRIGIKSENGAGITKTWPWVQRAAKGDLCTIAFVFFPDRFIGMPSCFGIFGKELVYLTKQRRRCDSTCQQPQSLAIGCSETLHFR